MVGFVSIGEAALLLGVSSSTLRRWEKEHKLSPSHRTMGQHRRYSLEQIKSLKGELVPNQEKITVGYCRVSSADQKKDLETQKKDISAHLKNTPKSLIIADQGSGLNFNKKGLKKLLQLILSGKVAKIVVTHKDRLVRFGFPLIELLCQSMSVAIEVIHDQETTDLHQRLTEDVITLVTVFSSRLYGLRSAEKRRIRRQQKAA